LQESKKENEKVLTIEQVSQGIDGWSVHGMPEVCIFFFLLYLNGIQLIEINNFIQWVTIWESSVVLARMIAQLDLRNTHVLEIGAGTAICSITAALCGAKVTAADFEPFAIPLILENASSNNTVISA